MDSDRRDGELDQDDDEGYRSPASDVEEEEEGGDDGPELPPPPEDGNASPRALDQEEGEEQEGFADEVEMEEERPAGKDGLAMTFKVNAEYFKECGQFEKAIEEYRKAIREVKDKALEAQLLVDRSLAYAALVSKYTSRPAERSEMSALYGLDPSYLAALALKDAQHAAAGRPGWAPAYGAQGEALHLLERYREAEDAWLEGLRLEPDEPALQAGLAKTKAALDSEADGSPSKKQRVLGGAAAEAASDDFECILCLKLFYEPVTTPCGHTFCKACFARAMGSSNKCPLCRTVLHIGRDLPISITLNNIIQKAFPEEAAARRAEAQATSPPGDPSATGGADAPFNLPLFVMSTLMPGEKMALNIFEPRYRLMVRRCMEGNRRFGMAQLSRDDRSLEDVLVEAEITDCHPLPDGRYYLEIVGRRRLTLMESWELDGYRMAKVRPFGDEPPAAGSAQEAELPGLAAAVEGLTSTWVERIRMFAAASRRGDRVREFLERAGDKPPASQPERLSFWSATLLVSFMPELDASDRVRLLRMRTTHERLAFLRGCLEDRGPGGRGDHEGCALM